MKAIFDKFPFQINFLHGSYDRAFFGIPFENVQDTDYPIKTFGLELSVTQPLKNLVRIKVNQDDYGEDILGSNRKFNASCTKNCI